MSSLDNLQEAFSGESQANRKYLAFAKKADTEGYGQVAKLFRAAAEAETIHALAHLRAMDGVQDTVVNLKAAVEGEAFEFQEMYPEFIATAKEEGNRKAEISFTHANAVEEIHHKLYDAALAAVEAGIDLEGATIHVCPVCGNTVIGGVEGNCEICGVMASKFIEIQ